ncbi:AbiH family protein [Streptococcus orisratti]|uniref:AbiH family protein n=1 Tax=Streptococcus orisratti TaxID=114652 RepID=UPI0023F6E5F1|nr:AbiH family protein [Streptococcus orisratti]
MTENILILGNGFDLAMKRKTSYEDFLKFSRIVLIYRELISKKSEDVSSIEELADYLKIPKEEIEKGGVALTGNQSYVYQIPFEINSIVELLNVGGKNLEWLWNLPDNLFIRFIETNKDTLGKNWSGIELTIADIAEAIAMLKNHLEELDNLFSNLELPDDDPLKEQSVKQVKIQVKDKFNKESNALAISYIVDILVTEFDNQVKKTHISRLDDINKKFIAELENLTDYLEFYLTYLEQFDFETRAIQNQDRPKTVLDAITNIEQSKVVTFNYTNTAEKLLGISEEGTHFIHGKINWKRNADEMNTMVFGIEDKEAEVENINEDLIPYQKFYQRAVKETGNFYEKFWSSASVGGDIYTQSTALNIVVFGHSVDPLDKEIFKKCFELSEIKGWDYRFIFTYYNLDAKRAIVKNIAIILGKSELVRLTGEERIKFVQSSDIDQMRKELLN